MTTKTIRQKLHNYLEVADDTKVKAIYAIMEQEVEASALVYTPEIKKDLDQRYEDFTTGKSKSVSEVESRQRVRKIIGDHRDR